MVSVTYRILFVILQVNTQEHLQVLVGEYKVQGNQSLIYLYRRTILRRQNGKKLEMLGFSIQMLSIRFLEQFRCNLLLPTSLSVGEMSVDFLRN